VPNESKIDGPYPDMINHVNANHQT